MSEGFARNSTYDGQILEVHLTTDSGGPLILTGTTLTWKLVDQFNNVALTKNAAITQDGTTGTYSAVQITLEKADTLNLDLNFTAATMSKYHHELWEVKSDTTELMLLGGSVTFLSGDPP